MFIAVVVTGEGGGAAEVDCAVGADQSGAGVGLLVLANSDPPMMTAKAASASSGERIWILLEGVPLALSTPGADGLFPQTIWGGDVGLGKSL